MGSGTTAALVNLPGVSIGTGWPNCKAGLNPITVCCVHLPRNIGELACREHRLDQARVQQQLGLTQQQHIGNYNSESRE